jgi:hypothetical protein
MKLEPNWCLSPFQYFKKLWKIRIRTSNFRNSPFNQVWSLLMLYSATIMVFSKSNNWLLKITFSIQWELQLLEKLPLKIALLNQVLSSFPMNFYLKWLIQHSPLTQKLLISASLFLGKWLTSSQFKRKKKKSNLLKIDCQKLANLSHSKILTIFWSNLLLRQTKSC